MIINREVLIGILLALFLAAFVGGFNYWKRHKEEKLDELAYLLYLYQQGKVEKRNLEKDLRGTPLYPYFLLLSGENPSKVIPYLRDRQLVSLLKEKEAYDLYRQGKYGEAITLLEGIDKTDFNYPSALLLKGLVLEAKGEKEKAKKVWEALSKDFKDTYFGRLAYAFLLR